MLSFLLLLQITPSCATPALCELLRDAEAVRRRATSASGGYRARIETENATLGRREDRIEAPTLLEQRSGLARWSGDTGFEYHLIGSRSVTNAIPLSRLAFLRIDWVIPTLAASRIQVITRTGPTTHARTRAGALAPVIVVSPLAEDREQYYRYEGGTLARRRIDGAEREVLSVEVIPREDVSGETIFFEGEMDLDPQSHALLRLFGRFRTIGRPKRLLGLPTFEPVATLVELINQPLANGVWAPVVERFEIQTSSSLTTGSGAARRVISRFHDVEPIPPIRTAAAVRDANLGYSVTSAPPDSLRRFHGWSRGIGETTELVSEADFSRYYPDRRRPGGKPLVLVQGLERGEFLRYNRIEGLFTGVSSILRFRDAAPGVFLHGSGGYAWKEKTVRGAADLGWRASAWTILAGASRALETTNDFRHQFDNPSFAAVAARDPWDYVERQGARLSITRLVDATRGSILRLEAGRVEDRTVTRHLEHALSGKLLRNNRNITPGSYWRGKISFEWNPEVSPIFAHDGVGFRAEIEQASGDLDYTRMEGRIVVRQSLAKFFFLARLHAGAVLGDAPPPQQLFELGDPAGLQGYGYKEFAGTRAALFRVRLTKPLGLLNRPLPLSSGLILPAFSPAIAVGFQSGFADAPTAAGLAAVRALGDRYDDRTGALLTDPVTGDPLPTSVAGSKLHSSVDIRIGLFGDALALGIARGLEKGRKLKFVFGFGRQF